MKPQELLSIVALALVLIANPASAAGPARPSSAQTSTHFQRQAVRGPSRAQSATTQPVIVVIPAKKVVKFR